MIAHERRNTQGRVIGIGKEAIDPQRNGDGTRRVVHGKPKTPDPSLIRHGSGIVGVMVVAEDHSAVEFGHFWDYCKHHEGPGHITVGTRIVVMTEDGAYIERAKD